VIHLVDRALAELLRRDLPAVIATPIDISFEPPDAEFPPQSVGVPAIDLFLYDLRENRDLRTNEWTVDRRSDGTATKRPPAVRVDFSYLITAWPNKGSTSPTQDEHQILGAVMLALLRYPKIPAEVLPDAFEGEELPTSALQPGRLQSLGEFWQALGGKPKTSLNYTVTVAVPARLMIEERVVVDKLLRFHDAPRQAL
jgi:hypothetical protein